jgi:hypothetical protein
VDWQHNYEVVMTWTFFLLTGLILTLVSAIFFSRGNLGLSAKVIAELAATRWDFNVEVIKSLANQNADNWIGVMLLIVSFACQGITLFFPGPVTGIAIDRNGLVASIACCMATFAGALWLAHWRANRLAQQAQDILQARISKA